MNGNPTLPRTRGRARVQPHGDLSRLTPNQLATLEFIWERVITTGKPPTVREIAADAGVSSPTTAHRRVVALEKHGMVKVDPDSFYGNGLRVLVWPPKGWVRQISPRNGAEGAA